MTREESIMFRRVALNFNSKNSIPVSKVIQHMQSRLSAGAKSSNALPKKGFEDLDKMIAHMRSRLNTPSQQCGKNAC